MLSLAPHGASANDTPDSWSSVPSNTLICFERYAGQSNTTVDQLRASGITPNDPRISPYIQQCAFFDSLNKASYSCSFTIDGTTFSTICEDYFSKTDKPDSSGLIPEISFSEALDVFFSGGRVFTANRETATARQARVGGIKPTPTAEDNSNSEAKIPNGEIVSGYADLAKLIRDTINASPDNTEPMQYECDNTCAFLIGTSECLELKTENIVSGRSWFCINRAKDEDILVTDSDAKIQLRGRLWNNLSISAIGLDPDREEIRYKPPKIIDFRRVVANYLSVGGWNPYYRQLDWGFPNIAIDKVQSTSVATPVDLSNSIIFDTVRFDSDLNHSGSIFDGANIQHLNVGLLTKSSFVGAKIDRISTSLSDGGRYIGLFLYGSDFTDATIGGDLIAHLLDYPRAVILCRTTFILRWADEEETHVVNRDCPDADESAKRIGFTSNWYEQQEVRR